MTRQIKLKVIASRPRDDFQAPINALIGQQFVTDAGSLDKETGEIAVQSKEFGGQIVLNAGEYELIKP